MLRRYVKHLNYKYCNRTNFAFKIPYSIAIEDLKVFALLAGCSFDCNCFETHVFELSCSKLRLFEMRTTNYP